MGCYSGFFKLDFYGTDSEKQMMERLSSIMDVNSVTDEWKLPIAEEFEGSPPPALIGPLSGNRLEYEDYTLAPRLFEALFPASKFRYSILLEYSVSDEDTPYLTVVYEDNKLLMRDAALYNDRVDN